MQAAIHQIVTFASEPFRGNPAFVLSVENPVPDSIIGQVADQLREGVLSCLRRLDDDRVLLTFHSRTGRHSGAGHSAAAAAHVLLVETGATRGTFVLDDGSERIVTRDGTRISVPWPLMPYDDVAMVETLSAALGIPVTEAQVSDFGYVAIADDPAAIQRMNPDMEAIAKLDRGTVIVTGPGNASDIVIRVFAPKLGLPEDPVCGTAHRIIVPYWSRRLGLNELHSRQLSPRGGDLWCRLEDDAVVITGESRAFLKGSVELPDG
ncbi:MAG: PhzF family phenazine biosynthesis protein [Bauldia sp.]|nr:PhzF family phenazine biosynthesis protein [Bauldia sp.]